MLKIKAAKDHGRNSKEYKDAIKKQAELVISQFGDYYHKVPDNAKGTDCTSIPKISK